MANDGIGMLVGLAFAAVAALGTFLYQQYQERQREQGYQGGRQSTPPPSPRNSWAPPSPRTSRAPPKQKKANCGVCELPFPGQEISRLPCGHCFHHRCIENLRECPFRGCHQPFGHIW